LPITNSPPSGFVPDTRPIKKCNDGVSFAGPYGGLQLKPSTTFTHLYRTEGPAPFAGAAAVPARVVRRHGFDGFVGGDPDQIVSDDCEKTAVSSFEVENFSGSTNVPCFVH